jgi:hypothetical protein
MMIPNQQYEFTPSNGDPTRPIVILGLQEYSPGQTRKVDVWKLVLPAEYAPQFGGHVEFPHFSSMLTALANHFCGGDEAAVSARLISQKGE